MRCRRASVSPVSVAPSLPHQQPPSAAAAGVSGRLRREGEEDAVELREDPRDEWRPGKATDSRPARQRHASVTVHAQRFQPEAPGPSAGPVTVPARRFPRPDGVPYQVSRRCVTPNIPVALVLTVGNFDASKRQGPAFEEWSFPVARWGRRPSIGSVVTVHLTGDGAVKDGQLTRSRGPAGRGAGRRPIPLRSPGFMGPPAGEAEGPYLSNPLGDPPGGTCRRPAPFRGSARAEFAILFGERFPVEAV